MIKMCLNSINRLGPTFKCEMKYLEIQVFFIACHLEFDELFSKLLKLLLLFTTCYSI